MATAFNICALIEHWRVEIPPGFGANESHGVDVRDPKWYSSQILASLNEPERSGFRDMGILSS